MSAEDRNEGVAPAFAGLMEFALSTELPIQTKHYARRGKLQASCGAFGQTTDTRSVVTCDDCKKKLGKRDSR